MIDVKKIETYRYFGGDIDGWVRAGGDGSGITAADWQLIDELRMELRQVMRGQASAEYAAVIDDRVNNLISDDSARAVLQTLAVQS